MNWKDLCRLRVERGEAGRAFGTPASVVDIYWLSRKTDQWERVMADMAPSILRRIKMPQELVAAAKLTVADGKPRALGADGRWLPIPEPPPEPKGGLTNVGGLRRRRRRRRLDATPARRMRRASDETKAKD